MKKNKRVIFNGAFLLIVFVLTIYGVFHGEEPRGYDGCHSECG